MLSELQAAQSSCCDKLAWCVPIMLSYSDQSSPFLLVVLSGSPLLCQYCHWLTQQAKPSWSVIPVCGACQSSWAGGSSFTVPESLWEVSSLSGRLAECCHASPTSQYEGSYSAVFVKGNILNACDTLPATVEVNIEEMSSVETVSFWCLLMMANNIHFSWSLDHVPLLDVSNLKTVVLSWSCVHVYL